MLAKCKILTISSDPVLVNFLKQELNDGDYEIVHTRHTGIQLKDIVELETPGFIILDIMMPALDGIGICLQLRQWTQLPILMLTTWGTNDGNVRGLNLGSDDYLTEPFGGKTLKERIELTLKRNTTATGNPLSNTGQ
jgi:two-component system KDP operon response regulator KdpE